MHSTRKFHLHILLPAALLLASHCMAQGDAAARYEIDAKRIGVNPTDKDALPRSREFLRLDSTYYVGWMYEGMYKFDRSADYLGYKNALPPLTKALRLMEKDYGNTLANLYSSIQNFAQNIARYQDMFTICNALKEGYDNLEMPDSVMALLDKVERYRFKKDYFGVYYHRAWTYHRNRFFTSKKFSFLQNSVEENEKMAFQWCYRGLAFIQKNKEQNDAWFGPMQSESDKLAIYHYLALLHCYNKQYDSSEYYYQQLADRGGISWSNYGGMQSEVGKFANAISYFKRDQFKSYERMLREPYYYLPELYVYAGKTKEAIQMTQSIISTNGSTPGFGWYNIALARAYLYDGQLDSSAFCLDKAANFKEIHIGTTLTQNQYDFTINLLRVQLMDKKIAQVQFLHKGWWYLPKYLYQVAAYKLQKVMAEYVVVNELAFNPERVRIVYDLFCAEATSTFDEAWFLLKDFSPAYFEKKYEQYQRTDTRISLQPYFALFTAKCKWEDGKYQEAGKDLASIESGALLDTANEKLFLGRLYEALTWAAQKTGDKRNIDTYRNTLFEVYPQLVPFSGIRMQLHLQTSGTEDETTRSIVSHLKDCSIDWTDAPAAGVPLVNLQFNQRGSKYEALINVTSSSGKTIVSGERLIFKKPGPVAEEIALRIFGKGGAREYEAPL